MTKLRKEQLEDEILTQTEGDARYAQIGNSSVWLSSPGDPPVDTADDYAVGTFFLNTSTGDVFHNYLSNPPSTYAWEKLFNFANAAQNLVSDPVSLKLPVFTADGTQYLISLTSDQKLPVFDTNGTQYLIALAT